MTKKYAHFGETFNEKARECEAEQTFPVRFQLNAGILARLEARAAKEGCTMAAVVERALDVELDGEQ
ncbi:hypothetical protein DHOM_04940 [Dermabacter hominis 1368]|uniref:Uncharacterized protein n=1 Tax=Dermabacter hominis 1368 TaxID=1450519 RepID=A0ABR4SK42_9MICO|nr:hypothetical protein [Dermabacter vaginalis]KDS93565.1 hypothetical protein DHOM_04940 [Dermabacter hominis 1368]